MKRDELKVRVPNEHGADISVPLLKEILRQACVSEAEWDEAGR